MAVTKKKNVRGGPRRGAGRKPATDPKIMIPLYVETSTMEVWGGFEEVRKACYVFLKSKVGR